MGDLKNLGTSFRRAVYLDQSELSCNNILRRVVPGVNNIDELIQLLQYLVEGLLISRRFDIHTGKTRVVRPRDDERIDVVPPARKNE